MARTAPTPPAADRIDPLLARAQSALLRGEAGRGRELALRALAQCGANSPLEARALACLAQAYRLASRFRAAHETAQRAAYLFQRQGDTGGEVTALATLAYAASNLGHNEEAVEAALLGARLAERLPACMQQAVSHNYLGVAYFWSRSFERAEKAFDTAARIAEACGQPESAYHPRQNHIWAELVRLATERSLSGQLPAVDRLRAVTDVCRSLVYSGEVGTLLPGVTVTGEGLWHSALALVHTWSGELDQAAADAATAHRWCARHRTRSWVHAAEAWAQAELAAAAGQWRRAEAAAASMIAIATEVEHEQFAAIGHLLACHLYETQGKPALAMAEMRRLRRREQAIRAEGLDSCSRVVKWQLDMRESEINLREAESASRRFERLSLEDALTGLANRRCFEQSLGRLMHAAARGRPVCVALIDVDHFKQVNDSFSHGVGDAVLQRIAEVLCSRVRGADLPARLAGDEFVVLFDGADAAVAGAACERIAAAVTAEDWPALAPGLAVSISHGVAQAAAEDSPAALLERADAAMYEHKRLRRAAERAPMRLVAAGDQTVSSPRMDSSSLRICVNDSSRTS